MEEGEASHKPHEQEAQPHEGQSGGNIHQGLSPGATVAIGLDLIVSEEELR